MNDLSDVPANAGSMRHHLTTRRGFIATASFGAVSLYALWAAFDAAPFNIVGLHDSNVPGGGHGGAKETAADSMAGHGGHGAANAGAASEEFRRMTEDFVARHRLPDGSVRAPRNELALSETMPAAHDMHASHGTMPMEAMSGTPVDVYLMAQQWSYEPAVLRLDAEVPYRFRMMATDASHGAALQLGRGSQIIRLRRGILTDRELTFRRPGEYLVYCTVYCGVGHDRMTGKIIVS
ncbi:MAG: hypothetical protein HY659_12225 [Rhizobiales bacterium]|nr:hypothetical protein [Hyphomicrobiales bacterium]